VHTHLRSCVLFCWNETKYQRWFLVNCGFGELFIGHRFLPIAARRFKKCGVNIVHDAILNDSSEKEQKSLADATHFLTFLFEESLRVWTNLLVPHVTFPVFSARPQNEATMANLPAVSMHVGPIFELEVNQHLFTHFKNALQNCGLVKFRSRQVTRSNGEEEEVLVRFDSFAYLTDDTLGRGTEVRTNGITLLYPMGNVLPFQAAAAAPANNVQNSPGVSQQQRSSC